MEISSAISKLQAATLTTKTLNTQQAQQVQKTQPVKDSRVAAKENAVIQNKNQEIKDKSDISKEALELLKNEYGVKNIVQKDSDNKANLSAIVNKSQKTTAKSLAYKNALKHYTANAKS